MQLDAQIGLPFPLRQIDALLHPVRPDARQTVPPVPVAAVGRKLRIGVIPARQPVFVPESQHRPRRPRQVHRSLGGTVGIVVVGALRRIRQRIQATVRDIADDAPRTGEIPVEQAIFESIAERQGIVQCLCRTFGRAVRRERAEGAHGIHSVVIHRVERQIGVGEADCTLVGENARQRAIDAHVGRGRAHHGIVREVRIGVGRPVHTDGMGGDVVQIWRGHHGGCLGDRNVVHMPAIRTRPGARGDAKTNLHVAICIGGETDAPTVPGVRGGAGVTGQVDPGSAVIG